MSKEGKGLVFNNYFQKIAGNSLDQEYRGQWSADRKQYCGLGEHKYGSGDVSMY